MNEGQEGRMDAERKARKKAEELLACSRWRLGRWKGRAEAAEAEAARHWGHLCIYGDALHAIAEGLPWEDLTDPKQIAEAAQHE